MSPGPAGSSAVRSGLMIKVDYWWGMPEQRAVGLITELGPSSARVHGKKHVPDAGEVVRLRFSPTGKTSVVEAHGVVLPGAAQESGDFLIELSRYSRGTSVLSEFLGIAVGEEPEAAPPAAHLAVAVDAQVLQAGRPAADEERARIAPASTPAEAEAQGDAATESSASGPIDPAKTSESIRARVARTGLMLKADYWWGTPEQRGMGVITALGPQYALVNGKHLPPAGAAVRVRFAPAGKASTVEAFGKAAAVDVEGVSGFAGIEIARCVRGSHALSEFLGVPAGQEAADLQPLSVSELPGLDEAPAAEAKTPELQLRVGLTAPEWPAELAGIDQDGLYVLAGSGPESGWPPKAMLRLQLELAFKETRGVYPLYAQIVQIDPPAEAAGPDAHWGLALAFRGEQGLPVEHLKLVQVYLQNHPHPSVGEEDLSERWGGGGGSSLRSLRRTRTARFGRSILSDWRLILVTVLLVIAWGFGMYWLVNSRMDSLIGEAFDAKIPVVRPAPGTPIPPPVVKKLKP